VLTCLTGLPIFQHGGFGPPHTLAILTLVVLAVVYAAAKTPLFGSWSRYVEVLGLSLTVFFHWVPAVTETSSRLPPGAPLTTGPDDPRVQAAVGAGLVRVPDRRVPAMAAPAQRSAGAGARARHRRRAVRMTGRQPAL
jgi:hypothetical protein